MTAAAGRVDARPARGTGTFANSTAPVNGERELDARCRELWAVRIVGLRGESRDRVQSREILAVISAGDAWPFVLIATMFNADYDRLDDPNPEGLNQAAMSCRRIVKAVADRLYPPASPIVDTLERPVKSATYSMSIVSWPTPKQTAGTVGATWQASLKDLSARLDALNLPQAQGDEWCGPTTPFIVNMVE